MITVCKLFLGDMNLSAWQQSWQTILIDTELLLNKDRPA